MDAVAVWLHDLLTEALCLYANSVAFPEYSAAALSEVSVDFFPIIAPFVCEHLDANTVDVLQSKATTMMSFFVLDKSFPEILPSSEFHAELQGPPHKG